jgi:hypothetical protein
MYVDCLVYGVQTLMYGMLMLKNEVLPCLRVTGGAPRCSAVLAHAQSASLGRCPTSIRTTLSSSYKYLNAAKWATVQVNRYCCISYQAAVINISRDDIKITPLMRMYSLVWRLSTFIQCGILTALKTREASKN